MPGLSKAINWAIEPGSRIKHLALQADFRKVKRMLEDFGYDSGGLPTSFQCTIHICKDKSRVRYRMQCLSVHEWQTGSAAPSLLARLEMPACSKVLRLLAVVAEVVVDPFRIYKIDMIVGNQEARFSWCMITICKVEAPVIRRTASAER